MVTIPRIQDTSTDACASSKQNLSTHSTPTPTAAVTAVVALTTDTIMVRFPYSGYRAVPVAIATYADGVRTLTCFVDSPTQIELVRVWDYGHVGYGIEVKSVSTPSAWHTVTAETCDCMGFVRRGTCRHLACGRAAELVWTTWQFAERVRANTARRDAKNAWGGVA